MRAGIGALTALMLATSARAQTQDTTRFRLDSLGIPITRSFVPTARAPFALTIVSRERIQDARANIGLDESLSGVPGVLVNNRQNFSLGSRIAIRGMGARAAFGVRGVRVLVDGIPLTIADGQSNLNNLDLGSTGSIHVLRGPASALFGNAAGGVISAQTQAAPDALSSEARLVVSDQGRDELTRLTRGSFKIAQSFGNADVLASISRLQADGYRDHSRTRQTLLNAKARWDASAATRLTLVLNGFDGPLAESPGSLPIDSARLRPSMAWPSSVAQHAGEATRQVQAGLRAVHRSPSMVSDVAIYGAHRTVDNPLPFAYIDLERAAGGIRASVERTMTWATLTAGVDAEAQRDDRREYENRAGVKFGAPRRDQLDGVTSIGPFVQLHADRGALGVTAGARYDALKFESDDRRGVTPDRSGSRNMSAPSGTLGVSWTAARFTLFANVASAFQTPTTTELINAPPAAGESCCPAGFNNDLDPQRAVSAETGIRGVRGLWRWEAVAYRMAVKDALLQYQLATVQGRDFFRNAGRTRHQGVELSAGGTIVRNLSVNAAYTWTDVKFVDDGATANAFEGNLVPGIPPHHVYVGTTLHLEPVRITAEVQHHAAQFGNDANLVRADAYTLIDIRLQAAAAWGRTRLSPFIAFENVLDDPYTASITVNAAGARYFEPGPGRVLMLGASISTGAWGSR